MYQIFGRVLNGFRNAEGNFGENKGIQLRIKFPSSNGLVDQRGSVRTDKLLQFQMREIENEIGVGDLSISNQQTSKSAIRRTEHVNRADQHRFGLLSGDDAVPAFGNEEFQGAGNARLDVPDGIEPVVFGFRGGN